MKVEETLGEKSERVNGICLGFRLELRARNLDASTEMPRFPNQSPYIFYEKSLWIAIRSQEIFHADEAPSFPTSTRYSFVSGGFL